MQFGAFQGSKMTGSRVLASKPLTRRPLIKNVPEAGVYGWLLGCDCCPRRLKGSGYFGLSRGVKLLGVILNPQTLLSRKLPSG